MKDTLPIKVEIMAKDIEYLKSEVAEIKQLVKDHTANENEIWEKVVSQMNQLLEKKADIWTEKALVFVGSAVGLSIIGAIMGLIFIK